MRGAVRRPRTTPRLRRKGTDEASLSGGEGIGWYHNAENPQKPTRLESRLPCGFHNGAVNGSTSALLVRHSGVSLYATARRVSLGASIQIRTGDLILTKDALCRLSYRCIF